MAEIKPVFHVFATHSATEDAIGSLGRAGFDMKHLSLIGKGYHSEEMPMGFYTVGDRIKAWGGGRRTERCRGRRRPVCPRCGADPGGHSQGPSDQVIKYESALKADKYLLIVHGDAAEQALAQSLLEQAKGTVTV